MLVLILPAAVPLIPLILPMSLPLTGAGPGTHSDPVTQAMLDARYEEFTMSGIAGAEEVGIIVGITLNPINAPGSDGAGSRTFAKASAQQLNVDDSTDAPANLRCLNTDFGFAAKFTTSGTKAGMQIIATSREVVGGVLSGDLHYLLRTEENGVNRDLTLYIGLGSAASFSTWVVQANLANGAHHFMVSVDKTTKEVRWSLDGAGIVSQTSTVTPLNSGTPFFGLGGVGTGEDYQGSINRFTLWLEKPPDAWFAKDLARAG